MKSTQAQHRIDGTSTSDRRNIDIGSTSRLHILDTTSTLFDLKSILRLLGSAEIQRFLG